eukprot:g47364.t1
MLEPLAGFHTWGYCHDDPVGVHAIFYQMHLINYPTLPPWYPSHPVLAPILPHAAPRITRFSMDILEFISIPCSSAILKTLCIWTSTVRRKLASSCAVREEEVLLDRVVKRQDFLLPSGPAVEAMAANHASLIRKSQRFIFTDSGNLLFDTIYVVDSGNYTCNLTYTLDLKRTSTLVRYTVYEGMREMEKTVQTPEKHAEPTPAADDGGRCHRGSPGGEE